MKNLEVISVIGQGSFGSVLKVRDRVKGVMAVKSIKMDNYASRQACKREVAILTRCQHTNVVLLIGEAWSETINCGGTLVPHMFIAMELVPRTLQHLIAENGRPSKLKEDVIKAIVRQILTGMAFVHSKGVIHRDLKPANILVSSSGVAKIADFGLSCYNADEVKDPGVGSRGYVSPEILLGYTKYSCAVDCWSLGCVLAELFTGEQLNRGYSEIAQLTEIVEIFGSIKKEKMPVNMYLPGLNSIKLPKLANPERQAKLFTAFERSAHALDLAFKLFEFNPEKRMSCKEALKHPFITGRIVGDRPLAADCVSKDSTNSDLTLQLWETNNNKTFPDSSNVGHQDEGVAPAASVSPDLSKAHVTSGTWLVDDPTMSGIRVPPPFNFYQDTNESVFHTSPCMNNADEIMCRNSKTDQGAAPEASSSANPDFSYVHSTDDHNDHLSRYESCEEVLNASVDNKDDSVCYDFAGSNLPEFNLFIHGTHQNLAHTDFHPYADDIISRNYNSGRSNDYMDFILDEQTSSLTMAHDAAPCMSYKSYTHAGLNRQMGVPTPWYFSRD